MNFKATVFYAKSDQAQPKDLKITFDIEAADFLDAKRKIKEEAKKRRLPPIRCMIPKGPQLVNPSTAIEIFVYVQEIEPIQFPENLDVQWKAPKGPSHKPKKRDRSNRAGQ